MRTSRSFGASFIGLALWCTAAVASKEVQERRDAKQELTFTTTS